MARAKLNTSEWVIRSWYKLPPSDARWLALDDIDIELEYQLIRLELYRQKHRGALPPRSSADFDLLSAKLMRGEVDLTDFDFRPIDPDSVAPPR